MKTLTIVGATSAKNHQSNHPDSKAIFDVVIHGEEFMSVFDGYHTMDELYDHRIQLFIALCKYVIYNDVKLRGMNYSVWRSKLHADGSEYEGWFILGIGKEKGKMITYHLPISKWGEIELAETLDCAPEWDGHTSNDVLERLKYL